ncbi:hypothetical protein C0J52_10475 [Blattella germanica]|nr:hypothetical protein C0J52_10475 [Blattella germanica]
MTADVMQLLNRQIPSEGPSPSQKVPEIGIFDKAKEWKYYEGVHRKYGLNVKQLEELERVNVRYLKRMLGVPQNSRSRLVYQLTRETFLIEDLRCELKLPANTDYKQLIQDIHEKKNNILEDFYATSAMQDRT